MGEIIRFKARPRTVPSGAALMIGWTLGAMTISCMCWGVGAMVWCWPLDMA